MTSLLSQRRQFSLNCKKNIALKIAYKIVALFTENYPSCPIKINSNTIKLVVHNSFNCVLDLLCVTLEDVNLMLVLS